MHTTAWEYREEGRAGERPCNGKDSMGGGRCIRKIAVGWGEGEWVAIGIDHEVRAPPPEHPSRRKHGVEGLGGGGHWD